MFFYGWKVSTKIVATAPMDRLAHFKIETPGASYRDKTEALLGLLKVELDKLSEEDWARVSRMISVIRITIAGTDLKFESSYLNIPLPSYPAANMQRFFPRILEQQLRSIVRLAELQERQAAGNRQAQAHLEELNQGIETATQRYREVAQQGPRLADLLSGKLKKP